MTGSVSSIIDGTIELVTNAKDAYERDNLSGTIYVDIDYAAHTVTVTDNAGAMTRDELVAKIATIGSFTSEVGTRGFFSRGTSDLVAIGDVYFTSVKLGLLNTLHMKPDLTAEFMHEVSQNITQQQRLDLRIPENGTAVKIQVAPFVFFPTIERMTNIRKHYALRDIFNSDECPTICTITTSQNIMAYNGVLRYDYPAVAAGTIPLIDEVVHVSGYPSEATFHIKMHRLHADYVVTNREALYREHGFLIGTSNANHSNSVIHADLELHPMFTKVRAEIRCDYLDVLMHRLGTSEQTSDNIAPCIRADRTGLNHTHPFVRALHMQLYNMIRYVFGKEMELSLEGPNQNLFLDIQGLLEEVKTITNMTFSEELSEVYNYAEDPNANFEKVTNFLQIKETEILHEGGGPAVYDFRNIAVQTSPTGNLRAVGSSLEIKLEQGLDTAFRLFHLEDVLRIVINIDDALVRPTVTDMYKITDVDAFVLAISRLVSSALARQLVNAEFTQALAGEHSGNVNEIMEMNDQLEYIILPRVLALISSETTLRLLVVNDVE
jgi:hypothetical protein